MLSETPIEVGEVVKVKHGDRWYTYCVTHVEQVRDEDWDTGEAIDMWACDLVLDPSEGMIDP